MLPPLWGRQEVQEGPVSAASLPRSDDRQAGSRLCLLAGEAPGGGGVQHSAVQIRLQPQDQGQAVPEVSPVRPGTDCSQAEGGRRGDSVRGNHSEDQLSSETLRQVKDHLGSREYSLPLGEEKISPQQDLRLLQGLHEDQEDRSVRRRSLLLHG